MTSFSARGLFSLLWNGDKAIEVIQTAHGLGLLARLDAGWCTLGALAADSGAVPGRLYKLMDCLESLGLVERRDGGDAIEETSYRAKSIEGVSTTTAGFTGPCRYGPVIEPADIITSLGEFERSYAGGGKL